MSSTTVRASGVLATRRGLLVRHTVVLDMLRSRILPDHVLGAERRHGLRVVRIHRPVEAIQELANDASICGAMRTPVGVLEEVIVDGARTSRSSGQPDRYANPPKGKVCLGLLDVERNGPVR